MKTIITILLAFFSLTNIHALEPNSQEVLKLKAKIIYIKSTYLKNSEKRLASLNRKIKVLEKRDTLSKTAKKKLHTLKVIRNKIEIWSKLHTIEKVIITEALASNKTTKRLKKALTEKKILLDNYERLCEEKFPLDFHKKSRVIFMKLLKKSRQKKS